MPRGKRRIREGFWIAVAIVGIVVFALLADWWKENAVIGWSVIGVLLVFLAFFAYRYASFRGWLGRKAKAAVETAIFKAGEPPREPIPPQLYNQVMNRARNHCQNPGCKYTTKPVIHHINMNRNDNELANLIALCPNCHTEAHNGKYKFSQLRNWRRITHSTK